MKRHVVIHPFLFAVYPLLELFYKLSPNVVFWDILRPLGIVLLLAGGVFGGLGFVTKQWPRAGFFTTLLLFVLLFYGAIYRVAWNVTLFGVRVGTHAILFPLWASLIAFLGFGLGKPRVWHRFQGDTLITDFLNIVAGVAIVISLGRYLIGLSQMQAVNSQMVQSVMETREADLHLKADVRPDIYYIVLDGYARQDVLQQLYGVDNAGFIGALRERGFYVAEKSSSNYIQTVLSLASSLNFSYLSNLSVDSADRLALLPLIWDSTARRGLQELGYQFVSVNSGYSFTSIANADVYFSPTATGLFNTYEEMVLMSTSAVVLVDSGLLPLYRTGYAAHRRFVVSAFEFLHETPALPGPTFTFFHIVSPHPPFVLDRDGNPVPAGAPFEGGRDGSYFPGSTVEYIAGYKEKLLYTNQQLLRAIDAILAASDSAPIIILQADHGPGAWLQWDSIEETCLLERTSIFNAYYLPAGGAENLYPDITPVNTFRVIFNAYFGTDLPLLADEIYFSSWDRPYDFVNVTDQAVLPCDLP